MHSHSIIVESMSAISSALARPAAGWTMTSIPGNAASSAPRALSCMPVNGRSKASPGSSHAPCPGSAPAARSASLAAATSPCDKRPAAISVARSTSIPSSVRPKVVVIAGPTAAGKSAFALRLAERERGTIINADASQLYADLRILSARPGDADLVRAPHRLYGVIDGAAACSAAAWAELARALVAETLSDGRLPIVVGGSGLYLRTLLQGIAPVPPIDPDIRTSVRALSPAEAYTALAREDAATAAHLAPADRQRTMRALEVVRSTGRPLAYWQAAATGGLAATMAVQGIVVDRDRSELHARIEARFTDMLAAGAMDEIAALAARRLRADLPVMKALGVPPLLAVHAGTMTLAEATAAACLATRQYAKRQQTWFRNQTPDWERV